MKKFFASIALLLACTVSQAATIALKNVGPTTGSYRWQCAAMTFTDSGITGACQEHYYSTARYAQPKLLGTWSVTWDFAGNATLDPTQPVAWPGCSTQTVITVNGVPMYFIAADSLGDQLTENYCQSYLVTP